MAKNNNTLVFNGLMRGMSWDLIKEAKDEIKRHLGEKPPTRKDILTDWIIGKDYMLQLQGELYKKGGHLFLDGNGLDNWDPNAYRYTKDYLDYMNGISGNNNNFSQNNNNSLGSIAKGASDSFIWSKIGDAAGNAIYGYATNNLGNAGSDNWSAGVIGSGSNGFIGRIFGIKNDFKNSMDYATNYRNQYNIGSNASILDLIESSKNLEKSTMDANLASRTANAIWLLPWTPDPFLNAFIGYKTNFGLAKLFGYDPEENQKAINAAVEHQWALDLADRNTVIDNSLELQVLDLLQHMTKNGGKLKKSHKFAEGGLLNTYDYGLEEVNAGGSHEENPNEGVVVSYAPDGLPNKVEEGETIHNDYVYSKRLEANEKVLKNNLLDEKYEGKSFADISKKLTEDRKQRPNDPISVRTNEENLDRLQGALEELKLDNKTKEVKRFLGSLNNDLLNALQLEMMDEYEAYAELLAQQQEAEDLAYQEEQATLEGMFGKGGHLYQTRGFIPNVEEQPIDATYYIPLAYDPQARRQVLADRYEAMQYAWNAGLPYYEDATGSFADEFFFGRKLRQINPDGTETIIDNAYLDNNGMPMFILTGEPPALEGTKGIKGIKGIFSKGKKASKVVDKTDDALKLMLEALSGEAVDVAEKVIKKGFLKGHPLRKKVAKNTVITLGTIGGIGLIDKGIRNYSDNLERLIDIYNSELPLSIDTTSSAPEGIIWNLDSTFSYDPINGIILHSKGKGGHLLQDGTKNTLGYFIGSRLLTPRPNIRFYENGKHALRNEIEEQGLRVAYYPVEGNGYTFRQSLLDRKTGKYLGEKRKLNPYLSLQGKIEGTYLRPYNYISDIDGRIYDIRDLHTTGLLYDNGRVILEDPNYTKSIVSENVRNQASDALLVNTEIDQIPKTNSNANNKEEKKSTRTSTKPTNLPVVSTTPPSSGTTVSEPLDLEGSTIIPNQGASSSIYNSFKTIFDPYIQNALMGPKPYVEEEPINPNSDVKPKPRPKPELGQKDKSSYLSYLRYAPILGSLGLVLSDTLGLTNQPDYSNIDMYRRAVDSIGGVNFVPIGGYQLFTPIDKEYIANQQLALSAAYNRALNNTNPVGSYIMGLINDAKTRNQIGDMYIKTREADELNKLKVAEYNRGIDITNARNSLAAQSENARLRALRANEYLNIVNMMNTERNTAEAARAANYLGLFTNIGNLGTDEMNRTMVNRNPALFYGVSSDGSIYFKNAFWGLSEDTQKELIDMLEKQGYKISK